MTPLGQRIVRRIAATGPMTVAEYMSVCLLDPEHGYYTRHEPFGAAGDFITAPEISQMFGEMLAMVLAQAWVDQGMPAPFLLAEIGPGRGTLMADMIRTIRAVPGMAEAARIHLIEASPRLIALQRVALAGHAVAWHDTTGGLPDLPLFLAANEFFDALPIRQFQRAGGAWAERVITADDQGRLGFRLSPPGHVPALNLRLGDTREGDVVEVCPAAPAVAGDIAARIVARGGAAVFVDYGGWHSLGDTFQAVRAHQVCDPLAGPGEADLTAHVDFEPLAHAARAAGAAVSGLTPQGAILERLGIRARSAQLEARLEGDGLAAQIAALRRLTHADEMGNLFKALAVFPLGAPPVAGFDPATGRAV